MANIMRIGGGAVEGKTYLYNEGDEYTALTGGWSVKRESGNLTKNPANMQFTHTPTSVTSTIGVGKIIDVTEFSVLKTRYKLTSAPSGASQARVVCGFTSSYATGPSSWTAKDDRNGTLTLNIEVESVLDISSLTGGFYPAIAISGAVIEAYEMLLE